MCEKRKSETREKNPVCDISGSCRSQEELVLCQEHLLNRGYQQTIIFFSSDKLCRQSFGNFAKPEPTYEPFKVQLISN